MICSGLDDNNSAREIEVSAGFEGRGGMIGFAEDGYGVLKLCRGVFVLGGVSLLRMRHQSKVETRGDR